MTIDRNVVAAAGGCQRKRIGVTSVHRSRHFQALVMEALDGGTQALKVMTRQNLARFEPAKKVFSLFGAAAPTRPAETAEPRADAKRAANGAS
jgi:hypothetical protein